MKRTAWLLALGPASCAVGPKYRPETPDEMNVPAAWHASLSENAKTGDLSEWWRQLGDPLLSVPAEANLQRPIADEASESVDSASAACRAETETIAYGKYGPLTSSRAGMVGM